MQVWNERMGIKYGFIMQKAPVVRLFSLSQYIFSPQPSDSRFPERHVDLLGTLFHFLASLNPTPPPPPSYLLPPQTLPLILSPGPYFFPPQPPTVVILFHCAWPLPVPLFTTLTHTRAHASCPHSKYSRAISYRREQKCCGLSYRPTLVRRWHETAASL